MATVRSHYENLKVARDAPPEVIRAAYRSLSQKYHPDRNPGDTDASRVMTFINAAYAVLSDPVKRKEHDKWIAEAERGVADQNVEFGDTRSSSGNRAFTIDESKLRPPLPPSQSFAYKAGQIFSHFLRNWLWYGIGAFVLIVATNDNPRTPLPGPKPYEATPAPTPVVPAYVRPTNAPNGQPWPTKSAYVAGYQRLHRNGLSSVTVDNAQNDSDVFVKLVSLSGPKAFPVRTFFIAAHGSFTLTGVTSGIYDIRYRDLRNGGLARSESFTLEEVQTDSGTRFSKFTMTLYKVRDGNMKTFALADAEF